MYEVLTTTNIGLYDVAIKKWLLRKQTKKGMKRICLCKQETRAEDPSSVLIVVHIIPLLYSSTMNLASQTALSNLETSSFAGVKYGDESLNQFSLWNPHHRIFPGWLYIGSVWCWDCPIFVTLFSFCAFCGCPSVSLFLSAHLLAIHAMSSVRNVSGKVTCSHLNIAILEKLPLPGLPPFGFWYLIMSVLKTVFILVSSA